VFKKIFTLENFPACFFALNSDFVKITLSRKKTYSTGEALVRRGKRIIGAQFAKNFHFIIGAIQTSVLLLLRPLIVSFTLNVKKAQ
jgi:hypothetical protein